MVTSLLIILSIFTNFGLMVCEFLELFTSYYLKFSKVHFNLQYQSTGVDTLPFLTWGVWSRPCVYTCGMGKGFNSEPNLNLHSTIQQLQQNMDGDL